MDNQMLMALLLSTAAGLSTVLGAVIIFFAKGKSERLVTASLGFAAGVMLSVSFIELYGEGHALLTGASGKASGTLISVALFVAGILVAMGIDRFVPHEAYDATTGEKPHKNLYRVGFVSTVAIGLHNFPEGIATFMAAYEDMSLGIPIAVAIALHNIPEGISVAMPIYHATGSRLKAFKYCLISGLAEPVGALAAFAVLRPFIGPASLGGIFALIAGIMVYIAIEELLPTSRQYGYERLSVFATLAGACTMMLAGML
jgi:ZIP family zinc transporter